MAEKSKGLIKAEQVLINGLEKWHWEQGNANSAKFSVFMDHGHELTSRHHRHAPCHAGLSYIGLDDKCWVVDLRHPVEAPKHKDFLTWVATDSPWSDMVVNKGNLDEVALVGVILNTEKQGSGAAMALCKTARYYLETPYRAERWKMLVDNDIHPLAAYITTSMHSINLKKQTCKYPDHVCTFASTSEKAAKAFFKKWKDKHDVTIRGTGDASVKGEGCIEWLKAETIVSRTPDGWGGFIETRGVPDEKEYLLSIARKVQNG